MARISSENTLTPAATVVSAVAQSNSIKTEGAKDARVFVDVTAAAGTNLDISVQVSHDNARWVSVGQLDPITGTGFFIQPLEEFKLSKYLRLEYTPTGGNFTLEAILEKKSES